MKRKKPVETGAKPDKEKETTPVKKPEDGTPVKDDTDKTFEYTARGHKLFKYEDIIYYLSFVLPHADVIANDDLKKEHFLSQTPEMDALNTYIRTRLIQMSGGEEEFQQLMDSAGTNNPHWLFEPRAIQVFQIEEDKVVVDAISRFTHTGTDEVFTIELIYELLPVEPKSEHQYAIDKFSLRTASQMGEVEDEFRNVNETDLEEHKIQGDPMEMNEDNREFTFLRSNTIHAHLHGLLEKEYTYEDGYYRYTWDSESTDNKMRKILSNNREIDLYQDGWNYELLSFYHYIDSESNAPIVEATVIFKNDKIGVAEEFDIVYELINLCECDNDVDNPIRYHISEYDLVTFK